MKKSKSELLRFFGIWFSLILASSIFGSGAWLSGIFAIAIMLVVSLTNKRYPILTLKNKIIIISTLSVLIVIFFNVQWKLNA